MAARSRVTTILLELLTYSVDEKTGPEVGGVAQGDGNEIQKVDSLHIEPQYGIHAPTFLLSTAADGTIEASRLGFKSQMCHSIAA